MTYSISIRAYCPPETHTQLDQQKISQYFASSATLCGCARIILFATDIETHTCASAHYKHIKILYYLRLVCILPTTKMCVVFSICSLLLRCFFRSFSTECKIQVAEIFSLIFIIRIVEKSTAHIVFICDIDDGDWIMRVCFNVCERAISASDAVNGHRQTHSLAIITHTANVNNRSMNILETATFRT